MRKNFAFFSVQKLWCRSALMLRYIITGSSSSSWLFKTSLENVFLFNFLRMINSIPRMKWNLDNSCSLHPWSLHWGQFDQANIKPEILIVFLLGSDQFIIFHNSSIKEQLIKVAALVELLQLLISLHSLAKIRPINDIDRWLKVWLDY